MLPDIVFCSTAKRAAETAQLVTQPFEHPYSVEFMRELYLAPASTYVEIASTHGGDASCVLMIGHNPGIESLASYLIGEGVSFPTAAYLDAEFDVDNCQISRPGSKK